MSGIAQVFAREKAESWDRVGVADVEGRVDREFGVTVSIEGFEVVWERARGFESLFSKERIHWEQLMEKEPSRAWVGSDRSVDGFGT